jgi:hypothetical protein
VRDACLDRVEERLEQGPRLVASNEDRGRKQELEEVLVSLRCAHLSLDVEQEAGGHRRGPPASLDRRRGGQRPDHPDRARRAARAVDRILRVAPGRRLVAAEDPEQREGAHGVRDPAVLA